MTMSNSDSLNNNSFFHNNNSLTEFNPQLLPDTSCGQAIQKALHELGHEYFPEFVKREVNQSYCYCDKSPDFSWDVLSRCHDINLNIISTFCSEKGYLGENLPFPPITLLEKFDPYIIRKDFPILNEKINGNNLIYFDNAATTQKPRQVIERIKYYYEHENSNVHRGAHELAKRTTIAYEGAREKTAHFLGAEKADEIVFVRGATEGINLIAQSYGLKNLKEGDEVIISLLEHHANIVPWQMVCRKTGAILKAIPVDENGQLILSEYKNLLSSKTKIVAITHVSNALGTITPLEEIISLAHSFGARVLVDGAQAAAHLKVDVRGLDCDFYVFSGHKIFGPTGIGVLYGKYDILDSMPPYQGGGNMIADVSIEETKYKAPPHRFEAGTGNIAGVIGLGEAIDYISKIGLDTVAEYEHKLLEYTRERMLEIPGVSIIGNAAHRTSILSFVMDGFSPEEIGKALNQEGIAVRAGHHCSQPILREYGLESTARVSFAMYNTFEEVDYFISVLKKLSSDTRTFY